MPPQNLVDRTIGEVSALRVKLAYPDAALAVRPARNRQIEPEAAARARARESRIVPFCRCRGPGNPLGKLESERLRGESTGCGQEDSTSRFTAASSECIDHASASSRFTSGICDIVITMSGNAFCSCSLDVFSSIPVRETVRESSEPGESPDVRFPPPPLLKTSDCLWLAISPIASDHRQLGSAPVRRVWRRRL